MYPLTAQRLKALCDRPLKPVFADEACRVLGGLARWWLRKEVLDTARDFDPTPEGRRASTLPQLSHRCGSCWIVCKICGELPYLRPAVLVPLGWKSGIAHSPLLPASLRTLADRVVSQVREIKLFTDLFREDWGLHPAECLGLTAPLADDLFETVESGWASLAGGLLAAGQGLDPNPLVWASAAWNPRTGLARVDGLAEKLDLARDWKVMTFFVPWSQVSEAEAWVAEHCPSRLQIAALGTPAGTRTWDALRPLVADLTNEPPAPPPDTPDHPATFERCRYYYLNLPAFTKRANDFYWSHLLPGIIHRYRQLLRVRWPGLKVTRFVTIVSPSPELAVMSAAALGAERCLLLHTGGALLKKAEDCVRHLGKDRCELCEIDERTVVEEIARATAAFTAGVPPAEVVLDLKPGTKKMTYALLRAAHPENRLLNLEPQFLDDRRNVPGTEIPELLEPVGCHWSTSGA